MGKKEVAKQLEHINNMLTDSKYREGVLHEKTLEQADIIRKLRVENATLNSQNKALHDEKDKLYSVLSNIQQVLAIETIVHNTHRERNEKSRAIVRIIDRMLDGVVIVGKDYIPF